MYKRHARPTVQLHVQGNAGIPVAVKYLTKLGVSTSLALTEEELQYELEAL